MNKAALFSEQSVRGAQLAKALSHPARIEILRILLKKQSCVCGSIVEELPLAQATVSQHLKELKTAGVIKGEIEGKTVCYCINPEGWEEAETFFSELLKQTPGAPGCC